MRGLGKVNYCEADMKGLFEMAKLGSVGFAPDHHSYLHLADFIDASGYGGITKASFNDLIPEQYWYEPLDFANFLN